MAPSTISAILATLDLKLVRGLRAALQDDAQLAAAMALGPKPLPHPLGRDRFEPEPAAVEGSSVGTACAD